MVLAAASGASASFGGVPRGKMSHSTASLAKALPKLMLCGRIRFSYPTGSSLQRMVNEDRVKASLEPLHWPLDFDWKSRLIDRTFACYFIGLHLARLGSCLLKLVPIFEHKELRLVPPQQPWQSYSFGRLLAHLSKE
mmetsp:Transcript_38195/g.79660  ORF Transcript_38195/g.79660 Transcript_38195/m.79660 type:complete len:137 (+) Transcript_38195:49-459(+)